MLKERIEAMRPIAPAMHDLEHAWNLVLARTGQALTAVATARMQPGTKAPLEVGMTGIEAIVASADLAARGYRATVEGHRQLGAERDTLLPHTVAIGDEFYTPPNTARIAAADEAAVCHLHAVSNAA